VIGIAKSDLLAGFSLREARPEDGEDIYIWRYGDESVRFFKNNIVPTLPEHLEWLEGRLCNPSSKLMIGELHGVPVSHVRLEPMGNREEISLAVSAGSRGNGVGKATVLGAHLLSKSGKLCAIVHRDNRVSLNLFLSCGYMQVSRNGNFIKLYADT